MLGTKHLFARRGGAKKMQIIFFTRCVMHRHFPPDCHLVRWVIDDVENERLNCFFPSTRLLIEMLLEAGDVVKDYLADDVGLLR